MPVNANVFINYGPYKSNGIVDHRLDRLEGLKSTLFFKLLEQKLQYFNFLIKRIWKQKVIKLLKRREQSVGIKLK